MKKYFIILCLVVYASSSLIGSEAKKNRFTANVAGKLPFEGIDFESEGYAGAFCGIHNGKLLIGGGTNYLDRKPWEGGTKIFHDRIFVFDIQKDSFICTNNLSAYPRPIAYGASVSFSEGILCIGGNDSEECYSTVYLMRWHDKYGQVGIEEYPDLPVPLSYTSATILDDVIYVAGGSSSVDGIDTGNYFFKLDLSKRNTIDFSWEVLPPFPGKGRIFSAVVGQLNGEKPCVYMFSGRNVNTDRKVSVFRDGLVFDLDLNKWQNLSDDTVLDFPVMGAAVFPNKRNEIVFLGGSSGESLLREQQQRDQFQEIVKKRDSTAIERYKDERMSYYLDHKGFSRDILIYDTVGDTIIKGGAFDTCCPILTTAVPYENGAVIASGEIKPGVRSSDIFLIRSETGGFSFLLIKSKMALAGLLFLGAVGVWFLLRQKKRQFLG